MRDFETVPLRASADVIAPDGSDVRLLPQLAGGSMAHFTLAPGVTARAVVHRTVEEIWFVLSGTGEMWRATDDREEIVGIATGVALTIPLGTRFQFRATGDAPVTAVSVTMPPWPGDHEAIAVDGPWEPTVRS